MADTQLFYGRNVLQEALACKVKILEIFVSNDQALAFAEECVGRKIPIRRDVPVELRALSHQGIAFRASHNFYLPQWDMKRDRFPFIVLCNHLEDVQNLGSLTRAAAAFGAGLLVHEERRSARINAAGVKVSAGQAFRMKFLEVSNLTPFCRKLTDAGYSVVGLDLEEGAEALYKWEPHFPLALVVGSESSGISKPVKGQLEGRIKISMNAGVESLNANQAATVAMSWVFSKLFSFRPSSSFQGKEG